MLFKRSFKTYEFNWLTFSTILSLLGFPVCSTVKNSPANRLLDSVGEGEGGMFRKNSMYIIYSVTDHQPRWDAWDKCSGLVHWKDPEESGGEGAGKGDQDGEYM